ncbi:DUF1127 domain-containing protein [Pseudomonas sp. 2FG]|uniref:DUF1127 domain-containing protein n=1 Tax=Pseudomonas sp. 2FG TaxID=2502191 RepID=UPI0010F620F6|nr:DUF1127 domain-containing protein [Pseudomonas sp. 2FG]
MKGQKGYAIATALPKSDSALGRLLSQAWKRARRWHELAAQRRQLASLSDAALKDLGFSRADVVEESERPFWDDPLKH